MKESENTFYFLGNYYQMIEMDKTVFAILWTSFMVGMSLFFIIKIYRRRRCPNCNKSMKRDTNDKYEIVYVCHHCNIETKTGISFGADDS
jgi:hypothetical protein